MTTEFASPVADLLDVLRHRKVRLWLDDQALRFEAPPGAVDAALQAQLKAQKPALIAALRATTKPQQPSLVPDNDRRNDPFPLTELQQAYWVGECGDFAQSAKACYVHHIGFDALTLPQLRAGLRRLQARHEVLRTRFLPDGTQVFAPVDGCAYTVDTFDFSKTNDAEGRVSALVRSFADTHLPTLADGPPLCAALVQMPNDVRLILALRLIVLDGPSLSILFRDLLACLFDHDLQDAPTDVSYRDYVLGLQSLSRDAAKAYWDASLPHLPAPPALPVTGAMPQRSEFHRLTRTVVSNDWERLKQRARLHGLTPNAVMLALYAAVLRPWSEHRDFALNVLTNYRPFAHPQMADLVGNHSNTILTTCFGDGDFVTQVRAVQANLSERLPHAVLPGVALLRKLQQTQDADRPAIPFVFTSGISSDAASPLPDALQGRHRVIESHLRTPQVWLDHQVVETSDGLLCYWDYVDQIFEPGLMQVMFDRFNVAVERLVAEPAAWHSADPAQEDASWLPALVEGSSPCSETTLASTFLCQVSAQPHALAVIDADGAALNYEELALRAGRIARGLQEIGATPGDIVAIQLPKGRAQIASVIGVSIAGMAWLPLDSRLPDKRAQEILKQSGARFVLGTNPALMAHDPKKFDDLDPVLGMPGSEARDLAYVIYTSGSTGTPKGVSISHAAVLNTLKDVNSRFGIGRQDRVLALSALSFDLSVYDIWGTILAGAAIVVPEDVNLPDPVDLVAQCARDQVTVWNSVPAFFDMATFLPEETLQRDLASLRVIMLSGDWIPLPLAKSIRRLLPNTALFSLGGATEAAIWSNYFPVQDVPDYWVSVPYGYALSGQQLHVLDQHGAVCPPLATGEIYIDGHGLADGYYRDRDRTAAQFVSHASGRRLYKTGDLGRYKADGAIEFLGRADFQLKLRGFRIEAGDVEKHVLAVGELDSCAVVTAPDAAGQSCLVALCQGLETDPDLIRRQLEEHLPDYMVPGCIVPIGSMPLTNNGKRDRKALISMAEDALKRVVPMPEKRGELPDHHASLARIWEAITQTPLQSENDNFFETGATSMQAVQFMTMVRSVFEVDLPLSRLFEAPTFGAVWSEISTSKNERAI